MIGLSHKDKTDSKIIEALQKFDEKTKERLAKRIMDIAEEESMSSTQRNCIRALKVICAIAVIASAPIVTYVYTQLQTGINLLFWIAFIPFLFLVPIAIVVDIIMKTPD